MQVITFILFNRYMRKNTEVKKRDNLRNVHSTIPMQDVTKVNCWRRLHIPVVYFFMYMYSSVSYYHDV